MNHRERRTREDVEREEEQRAIEEDRNRYGDLLPDLNQHEWAVDHATTDGEPPVALASADTRGAPAARNGDPSEPQPDAARHHADHPNVAGSTAALHAAGTVTDSDNPLGGRRAWAEAHATTVEHTGPGRRDRPVALASADARGAPAARDGNRLQLQHGAAPHDAKDSDLAGSAGTQAPNVPASACDLNDPHFRRAWAEAQAMTAAEQTGAETHTGLPARCGHGPNIRLTQSKVVQPGRPDDEELGIVGEFVVLESLQPEAAQPVEWLWPGRIPLGKLTMLVGDPNVGKSFLTLDIAARISRGGAWPDRPREKGVRGQVLLLSSEDSSDDTITPRLVAAGADLRLITRLRFLSGSGSRRGEKCRWQRPIVLPDDLAALEAILQTYNTPPPVYGPIYIGGKPMDSSKYVVPPERRDMPPVRMIVIDTLASYLPRIASNDNVHVRQTLQPLVELAERYRVAIVAINHLNKSSGQAGQYRPMGSLAFTAVSRAVWGVTRDPQNYERRLWLPVKMNLGPTPTGLAFTTAEMRIVWDNATLEQTWVAAMSETRQHCRRERLEAIEMLKRLLTPGPRLKADIDREAREAGISMSTVRRARADLKIASRRHLVDGRLCYAWESPGQTGLPPYIETFEQPEGRI